MSSIVVENLSKRYVIGHAPQADTLRDALAGGVRSLWTRLGRKRQSTEDFWALRDVSFSVRPGEVVGIIGRNGAGKSTLLKILSRITEPTTGRVTLRGRVASLLEVGTGFHPELTGRENIYLNGAILGMSRAEIRQKFDEIVAFSEVEKFLDTPVKRYSSGMYVRLAFAVAAHLDPEILIVDEVLAVGDAQFQKKCLGKMRDVAAGQGRTVLFVSHNLAAIQSLCPRAILLRQGKIQSDAAVDITAKAYLEDQEASPTNSFHGHDFAVRVDEATFALGLNQPPSIKLNITIRASRTKSIGLEFILVSSQGQACAMADEGSLDHSRMIQLKPGETASSWSIDVSRIATGTYFLRIQLVDPGIQELARLEHPVPIKIHRSPRLGANRVLQLDWQVGVVELDLHQQNIT